MDIGIVSVRYARALLKGATIAKKEDKIYVRCKRYSVAILSFHNCILQ